MSDLLPAFTTLLRQLREPHLIASRDGQIFAANVAAADALATSVPALEVARVADFFVLKTHEALVPTDTPFPLRAQDGRRFFCDARRLTTELVLLRLSAGPAPEARERIFGAYREQLRSFSGEQRAEQLSHQRLADRIATVGAFSAGVFIVSPKGDELTLAVSVGYDEASLARFQHIPTGAGMPINEAVRTAAPVFVTTDDDHALYPALESTDPRTAHYALACVPVAVGGKVVSVLALGFPLEWEFTDADRALLTKLARDCMNDLSTPAQGEPGPQWLERFHSFTSALTGAFSAAEVFEAVVDMGISAVSATAGGLWLLSDDGGALDLVRIAGEGTPRPEDYVHIPIMLPPKLPILDAIHRATPIWVESCRQMEERYPIAFRTFAKGKPSSLACVPLITHGRCIGGLTFRFDVERPFTDEQRGFMKVIAWHSAQAIERSRLYRAERVARERAEADRRRSEVIVAASKILAGTLALADLASAIARALVPRVADWCIVELVEPGLEPATLHVDPAKTGAVRTLSQGIRKLRDDHGIPAVIRTGKSELYPSIGLEQMGPVTTVNPDLVATFKTVGLTASMVVPISADGHSLGAISFNSASPDRHYDERDLAMAEELGRHIGVAVASRKARGQ